MNVVVDCVHLRVQTLAFAWYAVVATFEFALAFETVDDSLKLGMHGCIAAASDAGLRGCNLETVTHLDGCYISGFLIALVLTVQTLPSLLSSGIHLMTIQLLWCVVRVRIGCGTRVLFLGGTMVWIKTYGLVGRVVGHRLGPLWRTGSFWG